MFRKNFVELNFVKINLIKELCILKFSMTFNFFGFHFFAINSEIYYPTNICKFTVYFTFPIMFLYPDRG